MSDSASVRYNGEAAVEEIINSLKEGDKVLFNDRKTPLEVIGYYCGNPAYDPIVESNRGTKYHLDTCGNAPSTRAGRIKKIKVEERKEL